MQRILGLDIGTVRIGVSVSDPLGTFAQGVTVLQARGEWMDELEALVGQYGAAVLLVGMPRRTDGSHGPEAEGMRKVAQSLKKRFPALDVKIWDERFTTTIATQALLEGGVSRRGRKERVDKVAATLLLQNYLDSQNRAESSPVPAPILPEGGVKKDTRRRDRMRK